MIKLSLAAVPRGTSLSFAGVVIAELASIGAPSSESEVVDVTSHDSGAYREKIPGIIDPGEFSCSGNYIPSDLGQKSLRTAMQNQTVDEIVIVYPDGYGFTCDGFVKTFQPGSAEVDDKVTFEVAFVVSGAITYDEPAS